VAEAEGWIVAGLAVGGGLLALKLLSDTEKGGSESPPAGSAQPAAVPPQRRTSLDPGTTGRLPLGMAPKDVVTRYARRGRAHDAGPYLNDAQNPPPDDLPPRRSGRSNDRPASDGNGRETPFPNALGSNVPQGAVLPDLPATPFSSATETHEDFFGKKQPGPPSELETMGKPVLAYAGGAVLESVGAAAGNAAVARSGATTVGQLRAAGGLAGPAVAGVGLGLQVTQVLQDVGFFDKVVKPAGKATGNLLGHDLSKAVATALLPLSVPGGIVHSLVTPGESIVGNIHRAATASFIPEATATVGNAGAAVGSALGSVGSAAGSALDQVGKAVGSAVTGFGNAVSSFLSGKWF